VDRFATILSALPGIGALLDEAGFAAWLAARPTVVVNKQLYFVLDGDRLANEDEAKVNFALMRGLVTNEQVQAADSAGLPDAQVETIDIDTSREGDE